MLEKIYVYKHTAKNLSESLDLSETFFETVQSNDFIVYNCIVYNYIVYNSNKVYCTKPWLGS